MPMTFLTFVDDRGGVSVYTEDDLLGRIDHNGYFHPNTERFTGVHAFAAEELREIVRFMEGM
jgi:hypothetical protein